MKLNNLNPRLPHQKERQLKAKMRCSTFMFVETVRFSNVSSSHKPALTKENQKYQHCCSEYVDTDMSVEGSSCLIKLLY